MAGKMNPAAMVADKVKSMATKKMPGNLGMMRPETRTGMGHGMGPTVAGAQTGLGSMGPNRPGMMGSLREIFNRRANKV